MGGRRLDWMRFGRCAGLAFVVVVSTTTGCSLTRSLSGLASGDDEESNPLGNDLGSSTDASKSDGPVSVDGSSGSDTDGSDAVAPASCAYRDCVLADSPAAYWRLGEASKAGVAVDESGHGHDATYSGGVEYGVAGAIAGDSNTAIHFDGTRGLDAGNIFPFDGNSPFSLEVWVKRIPQSGYAGLLGRDSDPNGYALYFTSNQPTVERQRPGDADIVAGTPTSTTTYSHVVGTFDGSQLRLYVDGQVVASGPSASSIPAASSNFFLGTDNEPSDNHYEGDMDEAAVYDHALSAERVLVHYRAGLGTNR